MASNKTHRYQTQVLWTGNLGQGTANYRAYERSHAHENSLWIDMKPTHTLPYTSTPEVRADSSQSRDKCPTPVKIHF
jgi:hypothetical protein